MPRIIMYTTSICPYCVKAKRLLAHKGYTPIEIDVSDDGEREKMMLKTHGRRTVPQIFINDHYVGGSDDLYALEQAGELDALLQKNT